MDIQAIKFLFLNRYEESRKKDEIERGKVDFINYSDMDGFNGFCHRQVAGRCGCGLQKNDRLDS